MGKQVVHVILIGDIITMVILTRNIQRKTATTWKVCHCYIEGEMPQTV